MILLSAGYCLICFGEAERGLFYCVLIRRYLPIASYFSFLQRKEKYQKKAPPFAQSLRGQRVSSTLLSFGAIRLRGTGLLPMRCCLWTAVHGYTSAGIVMLPDPNLRQQKVPSGAGLCFFYQQLGWVFCVTVF
jgi:hypothetical protein